MKCFYQIQISIDLNYFHRLCGNTVFLVRYKAACTLMREADALGEPHFYLLVKRLTLLAVIGKKPRKFSVPLENIWPTPKFTYFAQIVTEAMDIFDIEINSCSELLIESWKLMTKVMTEKYPIF